MNKKSNRISGVFPHLMNATAFVDKVEIALWGEKRTKVLAYIEQAQNRAIGGFGRSYARCIPGCNAPTGNPVQLKYGVMLPYGSISPAVVVLWAGRVPVTCADAMLAIDGFMRLGCRAKVSRVELTFDTTGIPLERFTWELCTRARKSWEIEDEEGRATVYAGGVRSPLQLTIYQKAQSVVRVEFKLRSAFLRKNGIVRPHELSRLRKTRLWDHVSFLKVDQSHGDALPARLRAHWTKIGRGLPPNMPACIIRKVLRESRIGPSPWLVRSPREELLRKMLKNLIW
jgi:hypothetical protein